MKRFTYFEIHYKSKVMVVQNNRLFLTYSCELIHTCKLKFQPWSQNWSSSTALILFAFVNVAMNLSIFAIKKSMALESLMFVSVSVFVCVHLSLSFKCNCFIIQS